MVDRWETEGKMHLQKPDKKSAYRVKMYYQERNSMGLPIKHLQSPTDYSTQTEDTPTKTTCFTCHRDRHRVLFACPMSGFNCLGQVDRS